MFYGFLSMVSISSSPWREYFPFFQHADNQSVAYLDSAATSQMCQPVLDAVMAFDATGRSNVHRGVYPLSERATLRFEWARDQVAQFINAKSPDEIIFTHGCTEALNLIASSFVKPQIQKGDAIVITMMEHHANFVPWQILAQQVGAELRVVPLTEEGDLDLQALAAMCDASVKLISVVHASNVLGTVNPIQQIVRVAKSHSIAVCVDGAQTGGHMPIDVQALGVDFYVLSGHKMFAPFGIGAIYGRSKHLASMPPYQLGGNMIEKVSVQTTTFAKPPARFEAGTCNVSGAIGLGEACRFIMMQDRAHMLAYEHALSDYLHQRLHEVPKLRVLGRSKDKLGIASIIMEDAHAHDVATILGAKEVCARAGHHCTMPLMQYYNVQATTRISLMCYNTQKDIDACIDALMHVRSIFDG